MSADVWRGLREKWEDRFLRRDRGDPGGESGASYVGGALYFPERKDQGRSFLRDVP